MKKVPRYNSIMFLALPIIIYLAINSSLAGTLFLKDIVDYAIRLFSSGIDLSKEISTGNFEISPEQWIKDNYGNNIRWSFIGIGLGIFIFNLPIKLYFRNKRRGKENKGFVSAYTKALLNFTPEIISIIFILGTVFIHSSLFMLSRRALDQNLQDLIHAMIIVSIFTSFLILVLIYFGQKYRVQTKYIHHVYSEERLKKLPFGFNFPGLRGRFFLTTIIITTIPIIIVLFYFIFGIRSVSAISNLTQDQIEFLYGDLFDLFNIIHLEGGGTVFDRISSNNMGYYMDAFGIFQFLLGVIPGLFFSLIYIFKIVTWSNISIIKPIQELLFSMSEVSKGNLQSYTPVRSREETGQLAYGFNQMLDGLRDREKIKSLFGQYLSQEVSEEILRGNVDLSGSLYTATILFADIRGFTTISEGISPGETITFLNDYYGVLIQVIQEYGGIIDKFLGDGILVLFGVPIKSTDHADRAVSAAFEIQRRLDEFNKERATRGTFSVDIGIGIHTGEVIAGNIGNDCKLEYTVIGDTVNVASRIESLTTQFKTKILIGETVHSSLSNQNEHKTRFQSIEGVSLKGKRLKVNLLKAI